MIAVKHSPHVPATVTAWRAVEAQRSALNQPPVIRETCAMCTDGSYTIGARRYVCSMCAGKGFVNCESA